MDTFVAISEPDLLEKTKDLPPVEFLIQEYIVSLDEQTIRIEVIGSRIISAFKRSINNEGISSFSRGSNYTPICTDDEKVSAECLRIMQLLNLKMASFDLIAGDAGLYVIDVNATSNFASSDVALNGFNPLDLMAELIISEYNGITGNPPQAQALTAG